MEESWQERSQRESRADLRAWKWIGGLFLFLLGVTYWSLWDEFTGNEQTDAYQAVFALLGIFPAVAALMVAVRSERRAASAEHRTEAAEVEAAEVRRASLSQAEAMNRLADATHRQMELLREQEARQVAPTLALVQTAGMNQDAGFTLVNLSLQNMFVQRVRWAGTQGEFHDVGLGPPQLVAGLSATRSTTILPPGDTTPLWIQYPPTSGPYEDEWGQEAWEYGLPSLQVTVEVEFLHAPSGSEVLAQSFVIDYQGWQSEKRPIIRSLPVRRAEG